MFACSHSHDDSICVDGNVPAEMFHCIREYSNHRKDVCAMCIFIQWRMEKSIPSGHGNPNCATKITTASFFLVARKASVSLWLTHLPRIDMWNCCCCWSVRRSSVVRNTFLLFAHTHTLTQAYILIRKRFVWYRQRQRKLKNTITIHCVWQYERTTRGFYICHHTKQHIDIDIFCVVYKIGEDQRQSSHYPHAHTCIPRPHTQTQTYCFALRRRFTPMASLSTIQQHHRQSSTSAAYIHIHMLTFPHYTLVHSHTYTQPHTHTRCGAYISTAAAHSSSIL